MGVYFGLFNSSKNQAVSSYWKSSLPYPDDLLKIAKALDWDIDNDKIISGSYDSVYTWKNGDWNENDDCKNVICDKSEEKFGWDGENLTTFDGTFYWN